MTASPASVPTTGALTTVAWEGWRDGRRQARVDAERTDDSWITVFQAGGRGDWAEQDQRQLLALTMLTDALDTPASRQPPDLPPYVRAAGLAYEVAELLLDPVAGEDAWRITREQLLVAVQLVELDQLAEAASRAVRREIGDAG